MDDFILLRFIVDFLKIVITVSYLYQFVFLFLPHILKAKSHKPAQLRRYAVLIAARNEEAVLPHLLDSLRKQDYPAELLTVFVVADNCTDRTAQLAAEGGAIVYPRFNKTHVGKGYALNYLLDQIRKDGGLDRFDAFLVFDADNLLRSDYITQINRVCSDGYDAFCGCRNSKNFGDNWLASCHALQFLHESSHLNHSRMLIGACCTVNGTGYGFTRELLERRGTWDFFTLSEDTEFTAWCITSGYRIGYCPDAVFYDEQPTKFRQSWRQRTRWSQGTIQVSVLYASRLLRSLFKGGIRSYAAFEALTLSMWGYATAGITSIASMVLVFLDFRWLGLAQAFGSALIGAYISLLLMGVMTLVSEGRRIIGTPLQKIIGLFTYPIYMLSFIPIIITSLFRKFHWPPITHSAAISADSLKMK